jgi:hypothetical protein
MHWRGYCIIYNASLQPYFLMQQHSKYLSSSRLVQSLIQHHGPQVFKKKIVSVYSTPKEAAAKEICLHTYFDVKNHPAFLNRVN